jgi:hypothetical protein
MTEHWEERIIDLINGELNESEAIKIRETIRKNPEMQKFYNEFIELEEAMKEDHLELPSLTLEMKVDQLIQEEQKKIDGQQVRRFPTRYLAYAASIVFLVSMGVLIGLNYSKSGLLDRQSAELTELRRTMSQKMTDPSVSNRIEAVNVSYDVAQQDKKIIDLLIKTMVNDPSPNVRLAAVGALSEMEPTPSIRKAIVRQLETEDDSFVKIALIQAVVDLKDQSATSTLDKITQDETVPKFIKDEAYMAQLKLNKI